MKKLHILKFLNIKKKMIELKEHELLVEKREIEILKKELELQKLEQDLKKKLLIWFINIITYVKNKSLNKTIIFKKIFSIIWFDYY